MIDDAKEARALALLRLGRVAQYCEEVGPKEDYLVAMAVIVERERRLFRKTVAPELHDVFYEVLGSLARFNGHTKVGVVALLDAAEKDDSPNAHATLRAYADAMSSAATRTIGLALAVLAVVSIVISLLVWNDRKHAEPSSKKHHEDRGASGH